MSKKTVVIGIILAIFVVLLATGLSVYLSQKESEEGQIGLFKGSHEVFKEPEVHFVNVPNIVITLNSTNGRTRHYLLLDLVLLTDQADEIVRIESSVPLVKSSTVNYLTNMNYQDVSTISVLDLRSNLLNEYRNAYALLKISMPFNDVMISKMVFQ